MKNIGRNCIMHYYIGCVLQFYDDDDGDKYIYYIFIDSIQFVYLEDED